MNIKFETLCIGDMFNTKAGRWVKISPDEAICVVSGYITIGTKLNFLNYDDRIIVLYSEIIKIKK